MNYLFMKIKQLCGGQVKNFDLHKQLKNNFLYYSVAFLYKYKL